MPISPEEAASISELSAPNISPAGSHVVYCLGAAPAFVPGKGATKTQALWLADIGIAQNIFFLSDRHKVGAGPQVYRLSAAAFGGDPLPVTSVEKTDGVQDFEISPDGRWLAYSSADEPGKQDEVTNVITWGAPKGLVRLRILDLTEHIKGVQIAVSADGSVASFTWSPDSLQILYRLTQRADLESRAFPVSEYIASIQESPEGKLQFHTVHLTTHKRLPHSRSLFFSSETVYYFDVEDSVSAPTLWTCNTAPNSTPRHVAYGETDDAEDFPLSHTTEVAVAVACGLDTRIDVLDSNTNKFFTAFRTSNDAFDAWDLKKVDGKYIFAVVRSSCVTGELANLWSGATEAGIEGVLQTQLSSHHEQWASENALPHCAPFYWTADDGTALQGIIAHARGQESKHLPTVVVPHGGPYWRDKLDLTFPAYHARNFLASHGFLVLCPNYRGSQGRGNAFAQTSRRGMGKADYADVESLLAEAVKRGHADPQRVAIAGYSQGGFLAAWGITRPEAPWKTVVIGPDWEVELVGAAPWSPGPPLFLEGSPIRAVGNVRVPVLLLHGEQDVRIPLSQAIGFMRGLVRESPESVSSKSNLIIFPREGHFFQEKAHVAEYLRRLLDHLRVYL